jgi:hypothetical protein
MSTRTVPARLRALAATGGKLLFAVGVFFTVMFGWSYGSYAVRMRMPLPGLYGESAEPCTLWFIGSSTMSRWKSLPTAMAPWHVRRRGVAGATLAEIRERFGNDGKVPFPVGIVLYGGENDIANGRTPEQTAADMKGILAIAAQRYPGVPRFVVGLKPSPTRWPQRPAQLRYDALVKAALGKPASSGYFVSDGSQLMKGDAPDPRFYVEDGIHLNDAGYALWGGALRRNMEAMMTPKLRQHCLALTKS